MAPVSVKLLLVVVVLVSTFVAKQPVQNWEASVSSEPDWTVKPVDSAFVAGFDPEFVPHKNETNIASA